MKHLTLTGPNYVTNYNVIQLSLPMDLSTKIDNSDPVVSFVEAIKEVNLSKYVKPIRSHNTNSHDRGMLLRVILFAFQEGQRSLKEISDLCKTDIRYMWLSNEERPSHMAFQRCMEQLIDTIDDVYFDITREMVGNLNINTDIQFIDGTKIEANAHKNSFVYKKRILNARDSLYNKITECIYSINNEYGYNYRIQKEYCAQELGYIAQYLLEVMIHNKIEIVYGKGQRKSKNQRYYDEILSYYVKMMEYEYWIDIMQERNSCSKIDHDATFMATKWDYYNQSGVTRPCYNCQIAVSDGMIVNADIYQKATDTTTYQPMMDRYHEYNGVYPKYPVADAGYGSYDNYMYNIRHNIALVQKYSMYGKKEDKNFQKKVYVTYNWKENEEGYKVCPEGRVFSEHTQERHIIPGKELQIKHTYCEPLRCEGCPKKELCTKGEYKSISKDYVLEQMCEKVDSNLSTEYGEWLKKQRCSQVEGAFGVIKQNYKFTRFTRRGMKNVKMEFLLVCLGYNLMKYHQYRMEKIERQSIIWDKN